MPFLRTTDGWTILNPNPARRVYVSQAGSDSNDGLSEAKPVKTLTHARGLIRPGHSDHMLMRKGDKWIGEKFDWWTKSGPSPDNPIVFGAYGVGPKPILQGGGWNTRHLGVCNNTAFIGLDLRGDGAKTCFEFSISDSIMIEDCRLQGWGGMPFFMRGTNWNIRRSQIVDCFTKGSGRGKHSHAIFTANIKNLVIEETLFDMIGWHPDVSFDSPGNWFSHHIYVDNEVSTVVAENVQLLNCIFSRGPFDLQLRTGGTVTNCLMIRNNIGLAIGGGDGYTTKTPDGMDAVITNTVFTEPSSNILPADHIRLGGIHATNVRSLLYEGNIMLGVGTTKYGLGISGVASNPSRGIRLRNNIAYRWTKGLNVGGNTTIVEDKDNDWTGSKGYANPGDRPAFDQFIAGAREQSRENWKKEFTAPEYNKRVRSGFGTGVIIPAPIPDPVPNPVPVPVPPPTTGVFTVSAHAQEYTIGSAQSPTFTVAGTLGTTPSTGGETDDILILLFKTDWSQAGFAQTIKSAPWEVDRLGLDAITAGDYLLQFIPRKVVGGVLTPQQSLKITVNFKIKPAVIVVPTPDPTPDPAPDPVPEPVLVPDIDITLDGVSLTPGDTVDFGQHGYRSKAPEKRFVVKNTGTGDLVFGAIKVPGGFVVMEGFAVSKLAPGQTEDFTVRMSTVNAGNWAGNVEVLSNDPDEGPFNIGVSGVVDPPVVPVPVPPPAGKEFTISGGTPTLVAQNVNGKLKLSVTPGPITITEA
jgi:hypothetical protein